MTFQYVAGQYMDTLVVVDPINVVADTNKMLHYRQAADVGKLIENHSSIFIKNYGPSSLATLTHRGAAASQTLLTFEDMPLTNGRLGIFDLSLIPSFLIDNIDLSSKTQGGNGLTGTVELGQQWEEVSHLNVFSKFGSFGLRQFGLKGALSKKHFLLDARAFHVAANNDFSYILNNEKLTTQNAAYAQQAFSARTIVKINDWLKIRGNVLHSIVKRQIPKLTTQKESTATQDDVLTVANIKLSAKYKRLNAVLSAGLNEQLNAYAASINAAPQYYIPRLFQTKIDLKYAMKSSVLSLSYNNQISMESNDERVLQKVPSFTMQTLEAGLNSKKGPLTTSINTGLISGRKHYLIGGLELGYNFKAAEFFAAISRNVRLASLNDLYWRPGGNAGLLPEHSINGEVGVKYIYSNVSTKATVYHRHTKNWILWTLGSNGFFEANNIAEVRSRGVELECRAEGEFSNVKYLHQLNGFIQESVNLVGLSVPRIDRGDQLFYTPNYKLTYNGAFKVRSLEVGWRKQFIGNQVGLFEGVDAFAISDAWIGYSRINSKYNMTIRLEINNLLDRNYQVIERRPMPRRNGAISCTINLLNTKNKL